MAETAMDEDGGDEFYARMLAETCTADELAKAEVVATAKPGNLTASNFMEKADAMVRKYVTLIAEPSDSTKVRDALKGKTAAEMLTANSKKVGIFYMLQHAGESDSMPHVRTPRFRSDHLKTLCSGVVQVTGQAEEMPSNAVFFVLNAGVMSHNDYFHKAFVTDSGKNIPKNKEVLYLQFEEESLQQRRLRKRGPLNLMQAAVVMTHPDVEASGCSSLKERRHYTATSPATNTISGIAPASFENSWLVDAKTKAAILVGGVIRAGGAGPDGADEKPEMEGHKVPVSWHSLPAELFEEFVHSYGLDSIIALTMLDMEVAVAAIQMKVPMIGFCLNKRHCELGYDRLVKVVFDMMRDPHSELHEPALVKLVGGKKKSSATITRKNPVKNPKPKPKNKSKPKPKPQSKKKGKKGKEEEEEEQDEGDGDNEGDEEEDDDGGEEAEEDEEDDDISET